MKETGKMKMEDILSISSRYADGIDALDFEGIAGFAGYSVGYVKEAAEFCKLDRAWFDDQWYPGSVLYTDALTLYCVAFLEGPFYPVELGGFIGMSTCYIAAALRAVVIGDERVGHTSLRSVDVYTTEDVIMEQMHGVFRGHMVTYNPELCSRVELITADARDFLKEQKDCSLDFIFEDTMHTYDMTASVIEQAIRVLEPGGVLLSHDCFMEGVSKAYDDGIGLENCVVLTNGIILWRKM